MGQRGIDINGFLGNSALLVWREGAQGPHIVEAVCQLDQHDPNVLRHGHQHLAQAFCIEAVGVVRAPGSGGQRVMDAAVQLCQLGDAIHQLGDFGAEMTVQIFQRNLAVLNHVVEQGSCDGLFVQAEVAQEQGDFQGVCNVGFTGLPQLSLVAAVGE